MYINVQINAGIECGTDAMDRGTARRTACVSQNLVNCCTTLGTSCTTNPEQIEVMELEG